MKKLLVAYYRKQVNKLTKSKNSLSDEQKAIVEEQISELQTLIADMEAADEEKTAKETLEEMTKKIEERLRSLEEKAEEDPASPAENFLRTANSVTEWLRAIRMAGASTNGIKRSSKEVFANAWGRILKENGITISDGSESAYLPDLVRGLIQDAWNRDNNWLKELSIVGAKKYAIRYNSSTQDAETSRAKGHTPGNNKVAESLTFVAKELDCQFIYKLIDLDKIVEFNDDGALVTYITNELYDQYLYEIRRAILIGDGRASDSIHKITKIESVVRDATDVFVTKDTYNTSNYMVDELKELLRAIKNPQDDVTLFMNAADLDSLCRIQFGNDSTPQYVTKETMAAQLGVRNIIVTDMMDSSTSGSARFLAMRLPGYVLIGDTLNPTFTSWEEYITNKDWYRVEAPCGGAVEKLGSAAFYVNA